MIHSLSSTSKTIQSYHRKRVQKYDFFLCFWVTSINYTSDVNYLVSAQVLFEHSSRLHLGWFLDEYLDAARKQKTKFLRLQNCHLKRVLEPGVFDNCKRYEAFSAWFSFHFVCLCCYLNFISFLWSTLLIFFSFVCVSCLSTLFVLLIWQLSHERFTILIRILIELAIQKNHILH